MKKIFSLVICGALLFLVYASFAGNQPTNSQSYIKLEARGLVVIDPRRVGDEQRVPAIIVGSEVWSLEFTDKGLEKVVRSLAEKNVIINGLPKIEYHQIRGIVRIIIVQKVKLAK